MILDGASQGPGRLTAVLRAAVRRGLALLAAVACTLVAAGPPPGPAAAAAETGPAPRPLVIHFQDRPPYSQPIVGVGAIGLLVDPVAQALLRARIPVRWELTPSQRQLVLIQSGSDWHCGLGWFRTAEREALGKFSRPIYRDRPMVALTRMDGGIAPGQTLAQLLAPAGNGAGRATLLVKQGYSYGAAIDAQIAAAPAVLRSTSAESDAMLRMIAAGRADWMLVAPEEAEVLLTQQSAPGRLHVVPVQGAPEGSERHLYCNRAVPEAWMAALNRALDEAVRR